MPFTAMTEAIADIGKKLRGEFDAPYHDSKVVSFFNKCLSFTRDLLLFVVLLFIMVLLIVAIVNLLHSDLTIDTIIHTGVLTLIAVLSSVIYKIL